VNTGERIKTERMAICAQSANSSQSVVRYSCHVDALSAHHRTNMATLSHLQPKVGMKRGHGLVPSECEIPLTAAMKQPRRRQNIWADRAELERLGTQTRASVRVVESVGRIPGFG
jgi:hypothetical protein